MSTLKEANPRKATEAGINTGISVILRHYEKYEKNLKWSYDRGYKVKYPCASEEAVCSLN